MKKPIALLCATIALTVWSQVVVTTNTSLQQVRRLKQVQVDFPPDGTLIVRAYYYQELWNGTNLLTSKAGPILSLSGTNLDIAVNQSGLATNAAALRAILVNSMMIGWTNSGFSDKLQ